MSKYPGRILFQSDRTTVVEDGTLVKVYVGNRVVLQTSDVEVKRRASELLEFYDKNPNGSFRK
jgi:hypothetical protein